MLDQVLDVFDVVPDIDLDIMRPKQSLFDVTTAVMRGMESVLVDEAPDMVLVHGDTTTAMAASLACFYHRIPIGHVEAGLRSGNLDHPWPEEMNRRFIDEVATYHFAPTAAARDALLASGRSAETIDVTGNTVIDALLWMRRRIEADTEFSQALAGNFPFLNDSRRLILVTSHRRENFGIGMERLCAALDLIARRDDVQVVFPVHLNQNVREPVHRLIGGSANIHLLPPLEYAPFVFLLDRCYMVITDSGGIQEEAPALGKPVLVTRDVTERPEAVESGSARLVGTDIGRIMQAAGTLLDDDAEYARMSHARSPFGDGKASSRIVARLDPEGCANVTSFLETMASANEPMVGPRNDLPPMREAYHSLHGASLGPRDEGSVNDVPTFRFPSGRKGNSAKDVLGTGLDP